jgi:Tfp pilus assembly protein FimT
MFMAMPSVSGHCHEHSLDARADALRHSVEGARGAAMRAQQHRVEPRQHDVNALFRLRYWTDSDSSLHCRITYYRVLGVIESCFIAGRRH